MRFSTECAEIERAKGGFWKMTLWPLLLSSAKPRPSEWKASEQAQLFLTIRSRPLRRVLGAITSAGARQLVFLAQRPDEIRKAPGIGRRQKGAVGVAASVVCGEVREVFFEKRKKHGCRAGLEKKRVGED